jgi:hypothetical protein
VPVRRRWFEIDDAAFYIDADDAPMSLSEDDVTAVRQRMGNRQRSELGSCRHELIPIGRHKGCVEAVAGDDPLALHTQQRCSVRGLDDGTARSELSQQLTNVFSSTPKSAPFRPDDREGCLDCAVFFGQI